MDVKNILEGKEKVIQFLKEKGLVEEKEYFDEDFPKGTYFRIDKNKLLVIYEATQSSLKEIKDHFLIDRGLSYCLLVLEKKLIFLRNFGDPKYLLYSDHISPFSIISKKDRLNKIDTEGFDFIFQAGSDISSIFYEAFRIKRDALVDNIQNHGIERSQKCLIAQKIFDRVFFIYFLCHKGLIKNNGNKISGKKLFEILLKQKDFFKALQQVFKKFNLAEPDRLLEFKEFKLYIPYLNGGLFRPDIFEQKLSVSLSNNQWEDIFDFLNSYHWIIEDIKAVEEDEERIFDEERILTPEILGHVYERSVIEWENQASQSNEKQGQKNSERKKKGVYYTPEIITDYISINTITPYLMEKMGGQYTSFEDLILSKSKSKNEEALRILESIKILDPACGSGAFLIKASEVLFNLKRRLYYETKTRKKSYDSKFEIITENIYGVDILEGAVEISKLRLWLWLISDYEENNDEIKALPNIEYNLRVGNSLVGWVNEKLPQVPVFTPLTPAVNDALAELNNFEGIDKEELSKAKMLLEKYGLENYIEAYYLLYKVYRKTHGDQAKRLREIVESVRESIYNSVSPVFLSNGRYSKDTTLIKLVKARKLELFHWKIDFGHILMDGGFDLIIANPPYVKEYVNRAAFDGLRESPYYQGKMDLWYLFACKAIDLLKDKGILTFIAQNNWVTSYGASIMRNKVIRETKILSFVDFGDYKIFSEAGIQTMIMFFQKESTITEYKADLRKMRTADAELEDVIDLLSKKQNPKVEYISPVIVRRDCYDKQLTFSNSKAEEILKKIELQRNFWFEDREVVAGIDVHQDYVTKKHVESVPNLKLGQGVFILSKEEFKELNLQKAELSIVKPFYTTDNLFKYVGNKKNLEWIIYTNTETIKKIKQYPRIKSHLDKFRKIITSDFAPYGLHRARNEDFFRGEKIVSLRKCQDPTFTYTDFDCYVSLTFYVLKTSRVNLKYLTALLNSKLVAFWLRNKGKMQGNNYQVDKEPILSLPLKIPSTNVQGKIILLYDKIEEIARKNNYNYEQAKEEIKVHAKLIDQTIYELYDLTVDEISIIEKV